MEALWETGCREGVGYLVHFSFESPALNGSGNQALMGLLSKITPPLLLKGVSDSLGFSDTENGC